MDRHEKLKLLADVLVLAASKAREIAKSGKGDGTVSREIDLAGRIERIASELQDIVANEAPGEIEDAR